MAAVVSHSYRAAETAVKKNSRCCHVTLRLLSLGITVLNWFSSVFTLQGVVKKAVGLGGWHWLVLTNGVEVKLQRNALSVIEAPTGNEEGDDDLESRNMQCNGSDMASHDTQKSHRLRHRSHKSTGSSHKTMSRSLSCDSQSKHTVSTPIGSTKVDLSKLEMAALWRYWRRFNLVDAIPNPSKEQLVDIIQRHFMSQQMDELQVISGFVQAAKRLKAVCK